MFRTKSKQLLFVRESRNTVKVTFEDLTTVYALANLNDNVYAKVGYVEVELITDENLAINVSDFEDDVLKLSHGKKNHVLIKIIG